jgi:hypothetical protein
VQVLTADDIARVVQAVWLSAPRGLGQAEFEAAIRAAVYPDPPRVLTSVKVRAKRPMLFEVTIMTDLSASVREVVEADANATEAK